MKATPPCPTPAASKARWPMVVRCLTALIGGYAATAGLSALSARLLPIDRAEATSWALILSILLYPVIALWCFHEPRLGRICASVWGSALLSAALLWWLGVRA